MEAGTTKQLRKNRTVFNGIIFILLIIGIMAFQYSDDVLRYLDPQAAPLGIDILQPAIVACIYVMFGMVFSTVMAAFMLPQVKENAFGTWSRFGIFFCLCFAGFCLLAGSIL